MSHRYLIIGSGVAAIAAAESIRSHDPAGEVTVVGDDPHGYYSRPGLAYYLNKLLPEHQIFPRPVEELRTLFPKRIYARVTALHPERHEIILHDGRHLRYDRLLLATGSVAAPGDFPGNDLAGVVKLDTLEDVRSILKLARRGRSAVVVGGGIIAVELAEGLAAQGLYVHYFLRSDRFWSNVLDETESRLVERGLAKAGIQLHYRTQVAQALGKHGSLSAVVTKGGETVPCQVLGVAIGLRARMELARQAGLATNKGILVNEHLETSAADIYAAGDVAEMHSSSSDESWYETLWPKARLQGHVAGVNMTGTRTRCQRMVLYNAVRIGGISTTTIGRVQNNPDPNPGLVTVTGSPCAAWQIAPTLWHREGRAPEGRVRILVGERTIEGALVMGDQSLARPLLQLIENSVDISPIRPALQENPESGLAQIASWLEGKNIYVEAQP